MYNHTNVLKSMAFGAIFIATLWLAPVFAVGPAGVDDPTLWLDADDVNGDGTPAADPVSTWTDKSGSSNDVTAAAGTGPAPIANAQNGKTVLDFDNDSLATVTAAPITANSAYTKLVVFKLDTLTTSNNLISSSASVALWTNGSTGLKTYHDGINFNETAPGTINATDYFIATVRYGNGTTTSITNINGTEGASETATRDFTANPIEIGSFEGDNFLDGQIAEALVYDRALTDQEIEDVECYLSTKWAITITNTCNGAANQSPTNISLSPSSVADGTPIGTLVGTLATTDADSGDTHTYSLVSGAGDEDNAKFMLNAGNNDSLALNFAPDFANPEDLGDTAGNNTYSIRVQSADGVSTAFSKAIVVTVTASTVITPAVCSFTPDSGSGATAVTATCTGVEMGGSVTVTGLSCGAVVNGTVTCTGTAQSLGSSPVITTTNAQGVSVETSASGAGGFSQTLTSGGGGGSMKWPFLILLMTGLWIRMSHKRPSN